jgi:uncharacterized protein YggU (UPF0235/DUF167 family)
MKLRRDDWAGALAAAALAALVGVPPSAVTLRTGARARDKVFAVDGVSEADLERALDPL